MCIMHKIHLRLLNYLLLRLLLRCIVCYVRMLHLRMQEKKQSHCANCLPPSPLRPCTT